MRVTRLRNQSLASHRHGPWDWAPAPHYTGACWERPGSGCQAAASLDCSPARGFAHAPLGCPRGDDQRSYCLTNTHLNVMNLYI